MEPTTALAPPKPEETSFPACQQPGELTRNPLAFLTDKSAFDHLWRVALGYSRSCLVPMQFQKKPDDCFIVCQLAIRMNVDPFMLMQSTYIVHGKPGFEGKLAIALLNASGKIKGTLKTTFSGEGAEYGCQAWCIDRETGDRITGPKVTWKMVKAEGWDATKSGQKSKWTTMPELMFVYRAGTYLIRTNYPEVLMGMQTVEEVEDVSREQASDNQKRVELLLSGQPTETSDKQPPVEIDTTSEPAVEQPPAAEPASADEADAVAQFIDDVNSLNTPKECDDAAKGIPAAWTVENRGRCSGAIKTRKAAIHGARGGQKTMLPSAVAGE